MPLSIHARLPEGHSDLRILREFGFHVLHKFMLHRLLASQIHVGINRCGLNIFMAQAVLYISKTLSGQKHTDCATVTKAMNRIDIFEAFRIQGFVQIFFTDAVNTVSGYFFAALIDE